MSTEAVEETLQQKIEKLTRENELLRAHSALPESPTSVLELVDPQSEDDYFTPVKRKTRVFVDVYNKCAKTMIDHMRERDKWRQNNYDDDLGVNTKLFDMQHYLIYADKSHAKYSNGSLVNCLNKMRHYMGLKAEISPKQGRELHVLMTRLTKKRGVTKEKDKITLDPVRCDFKEFIGNVCLDHFVNPLIPKETGKSSHDYQKRIKIIAEQIRKIFFGEPLETAYFWSGDDPDAEPNVIMLPTLGAIVKEIKAKLYEKENQEMKYIKKYLAEYDAYMSPENKTRTEEQDQMHKNSTPVIEQYKREKFAEGVTITAQETRKGGIGRARLFSHFAFVADESTQLDNDLSMMNTIMETSLECMDPVERLVASHSALTSKQQRARIAKTQDEEKADVEVAAMVGTEAAPGVFIAAYAQPKVLSRLAFADSSDNTISFKKATKAKIYQSTFLADGDGDAWDENQDGEAKQMEFNLVSHQA